MNNSTINDQRQIDYDRTQAFKKDLLALLAHHKVQLHAFVENYGDGDIVAYMDVLDEDTLNSIGDLTELVE